MAPTLYAPWMRFARIWGIPRDTVLAVPMATSSTLYRLVKHDPPEASDFRPMNARYAERRQLPELLRLGLSHFTTAENARTWIWSDEQMVASVDLPANPRIHVARTDEHRLGHVEVWCPADLLDDLIESAKIVE